MPKGLDPSKRHVLLQRIHHRRRLRRHVLTLLTVPFLLLAPRGHSIVPISPEMPSMESKVCLAIIEWTWAPHAQVIGGDLSWG